MHIHIYMCVCVCTICTHSVSQRITADHFVDEIEINDYPQTARYKVPSEYPLSTPSTPASSPRMEGGEGMGRKRQTGRIDWRRVPL